MHFGRVEAKLYIYGGFFFEIKEPTVLVVDAFPAAALKSVVFAQLDQAMIQTLSIVFF